MNEQKIYTYSRFIYTVDLYIRSIYTVVCTTHCIAKLVSVVFTNWTHKVISIQNSVKTGHNWLRVTLANNEKFRGFGMHLSETWTDLFHLTTEPHIAKRPMITDLTKGPMGDLARRTLMMVVGSVNGWKVWSFWKRGNGSWILVQISSKIGKPWALYK